MPRVKISACLDVKISAILCNDENREVILIVKDDQDSAEDLLDLFNRGEKSLLQILEGVADYSIVRMVNRSTGTDDTFNGADFDPANLLAKFPHIIQLDFDDIDIRVETEVEVERDAGYVRFPEKSETFDDHVRRCAQPEHFAYVFGVYDNYGQRVNAYQSIACGTGPLPDAGACAAAQAPLWPGFLIAVWTDPSIRLPEKLRFGPTPDATAVVPYRG